MAAFQQTGLKRLERLSRATPATSRLISPLCDVLRSCHHLILVKRDSFVKLRNGTGKPSDPTAVACLCAPREMCRDFYKGNSSAKAGFGNVDHSFITQFITYKVLQLRWVVIAFR